MLTPQQRVHSRKNFELEVIEELGDFGDWASKDFDEGVTYDARYGDQLIFIVLLMGDPLSINTTNLRNMLPKADSPSHLLIVVHEDMMPAAPEQTTNAPKWLRELHTLYYGRVYVWCDNAPPVVHKTFGEAVEPRIVQGECGIYPCHFEYVGGVLRTLRYGELFDFYTEHPNTLYFRTVDGSLYTKTLPDKYNVVLLNDPAWWKSGVRQSDIDARKQADAKQKEQAERDKRQQTYTARAEWTYKGEPVGNIDFGKYGEGDFKRVYEDLMEKIRERQEQARRQRQEDERQRQQREQETRQKQQTWWDTQWTQSAAAPSSSDYLADINNMPRFADEAYHVLQIAATATPSELKAQYLALMRQYHPDINKHPDATKHAQRINRAAEILRIR